MGNRAVITQSGSNKAVYLHWNGGRDSIVPLLYYAKNFATFASISESPKALNTFALVCDCVGLNPYITQMDRADTDNGDNGVYYIDENYNITGRAFNERNEQREYNFNEFLLWIDDNMPKSKQRGKEHIESFIAKEQQAH